MKKKKNDSGSGVQPCYLFIHNLLKKKKKRKEKNMKKLGHLPSLIKGMFEIYLF